MISLSTKIWEHYNVIMFIQQVYTSYTSYWVSITRYSIIKIKSLPNIPLLPQFLYYLVLILSKYTSKLHSIFKFCSVKTCGKSNFLFDYWSLITRNVFLLGLTYWCVLAMRLILLNTTRLSLSTILLEKAGKDSMLRMKIMGQLQSMQSKKQEHMSPQLFGARPVLA